MKHINLNNSTDLEKLRENINKAFEKRIATAKVNESLDSLSKLSLGAIKNLFEAVSDKLYENEKGKTVIKKYIKAIKECPDARNEYAILENITRPKHVSDSANYVAEMFTIYSVNENKLNDCKNKLAKVLSEGVKICGLNEEEINNAVSTNKELNESVEYLLTTKKTASNLHEHVNRVSHIKNYIENRIPDKIEESSESVKSLVESLDELFTDNGLSSWENKAIRDLAVSNLSNSDKQALFEQYKNECCNILDESLSDKGISVEDRARLSSMKEQLNIKKYSEGTLSEDILMLSKLIYTLSE